MTTKARRKSKPATSAETTLNVSPRKLKRTFKVDKHTGKLVDVTPPHIKAMLPKRKVKPGVPMIAPPGNYPMVADSISVHPKQVGALRALLQRKGLPGEVLADGRIKVDSAADWKRHCEGRGYGARNGGYNDPQFRRS